MRNLFILLFVSVFFFACSKDDAEEMMDSATDAAESAMENAGEMAEDAGNATMEMDEDDADAEKEMAKADGNGPTVEPLPDWDSLPPIEEVFAEDGSTEMENETKTE